MSTSQIPLAGSSSSNVPNAEAEALPSSSFSLDQAHVLRQIIRSAKECSPNFQDTLGTLSQELQKHIFSAYSDYHQMHTAEAKESILKDPQSLLQVTNRQNLSYLSLLLQALENAPEIVYVENLENTIHDAAVDDTMITGDVFIHLLYLKELEEKDNYRETSNIFDFIMHSSRGLVNLLPDEAVRYLYTTPLNKIRDASSLLPLDFLLLAKLFGNDLKEQKPIFFRFYTGKGWTHFGLVFSQAYATMLIEEGLQNAPHALMFPDETAPLDEIFWTEMVQCLVSCPNSLINSFLNKEENLLVCKKYFTPLTRFRFPDDLQCYWLLSALSFFIASLQKCTTEEELLYRLEYLEPFFRFHALVCIESMTGLSHKSQFCQPDFSVFVRPARSAAIQEKRALMPIRFRTVAHYIEKMCEQESDSIGTLWTRLVRSVLEEIVHPPQVFLRLPCWIKKVSVGSIMPSLPPLIEDPCIAPIAEKFAALQISSLLLRRLKRVFLFLPHPEAFSHCINSYFDVVVKDPNTQLPQKLPATYGALFTIFYICNEVEQVLFAASNLYAENQRVYNLPTREQEPLSLEMLMAVREDIVYFNSHDRENLTNWILLFRSIITRLEPLCELDFRKIDYILHNSEIPESKLRQIQGKRFVEEALPALFRSHIFGSSSREDQRKINLLNNPLFQRKMISLFRDFHVDQQELESWSIPKELEELISGLSYLPKILESLHLYIPILEATLVQPNNILGSFNKNLQELERKIRSFDLQPMVSGRRRRKHMGKKSRPVKPGRPLMIASSSANTSDPEEAKEAREQLKQLAAIRGLYPSQSTVSPTLSSSSQRFFSVVSLENPRNKKKVDIALVSAQLAFEEAKNWWLILHQEFPKFVKTSVLIETMGSLSLGIERMVDATTEEDTKHTICYTYMHHTGKYLIGLEVFEKMYIRFRELGEDDAYYSSHRALHPFLLALIRFADARSKFSSIDVQQISSTNDCLRTLFSDLLKGASISPIGKEYADTFISDYLAQLPILDESVFSIEESFSLPPSEWHTQMREEVERLIHLAREFKPSTKTLRSRKRGLLFTLQRIQGLGELFTSVPQEMQILVARSIVHVLHVFFEKYIRLLSEFYGNRRLGLDEHDVKTIIENICREKEYPHVTVLEYHPTRISWWKDGHRLQRLNDPLFFDLRVNPVEEVHQLQTQVFELIVYIHDNLNKAE